MQVDIKIDTRAFAAAMSRFADNSKKSSREILDQQAKLFVRDVMRITPPNTGGKGGRAQGTGKVRADLKRLFRPVKDNSKDAQSGLESIHAANRDSRGRVRKKVTRVPVRRSEYQAFLKKQLEEVGKLLSGWSAAAKRLGLTVPAWVSRHGSERGDISVETSGRTLKVRIENAVRFATNVPGLERRVNDALANRAKQMNKQVENFAVQAASKKAGFK